MDEYFTAKRIYYSTLIACFTFYSVAAVEAAGGLYYRLYMKVHTYVVGIALDFKLSLFVILWKSGL